jgi:hypothetical protein
MHKPEIAFKSCFFALPSFKIPYMKCYWNLYMYLQYDGADKKEVQEAEKNVGMMKREDINGLPIPIIRTSSQLLAIQIPSASNYHSTRDSKLNPQYC